MISAIEDVHHLHNKCIERSLCEDQTLAQSRSSSASVLAYRASDTARSPVFARYTTTSMNLC